MTSAGKKLQDIYDAGAKALTELQDQSTNNFKRTQEEHAESMKSLTKKSSQSQHDKLDDLQTQLKQLMHKSQERLKSVLVAENEQNQGYAVSLVDELKIRTDQMKSKLAALGQSHNENVDFAFNVACQNYLSDLGTAKTGLDENAARSTTDLNAYGSTVSDKLMQTTEQAFWQQYEQSQQSCGSFFITAREQEGTITDLSHTLTQSLESNCQSRLAEAKALATTTTEKIESSIASLLQTIAQHATSVETDSNKRYTRLTEEHFQKVDARLSNFADDLSNLHDSITNKLGKNTDGFANDLLEASAQAQDGLRIKCDQAVSNVGSTFTDFKQRLEKRLQLSRGQKQTLEEDKNKILLAMKGELLSIYDLFSKKITTLLSDSRAELANMTKAVESKILAAVDTCNEQVNNSASSTQKQIEDEVTMFLQELSNSRKAAVEEINFSAEGSLPLVNVPQNTNDDLAHNSFSNDLSTTFEAGSTKEQSDLELENTEDVSTTKRSRKHKSEDPKSGNPIERPDTPEK